MGSKRTESLAMRRGFVYTREGLPPMLPTARHLRIEEN
jgi:hypothetical protein